MKFENPTTVESLSVQYIEINQVEAKEMSSADVMTK